MFTLPCTHVYWAWQIIISISWSIIVSIVGYLQGLDSYNNYIIPLRLNYLLLIPTMQSRDRCFPSVMYLMRSQMANCVSKLSEKKKGKIWECKRWWCLRDRLLSDGQHLSRNHPSDTSSSTEHPPRGANMTNKQGPICCKHWAKQTRLPQSNFNAPTCQSAPANVNILQSVFW